MGDAAPIPFVEHDNSIVNKDALQEACIARDDTDTYFEKFTKASFPSPTWRRYVALFDSAVNRMVEKAEDAFSEVRQAGDAYRRVTDRAARDQKMDEYMAKVHSLLKRHCSPPIA